MFCLFFFYIFCLSVFLLLFFFFNDTATTEIYTLSLHDALPICSFAGSAESDLRPVLPEPRQADRSEEHTSELQSRFDLVCRLLLEKKNKTITENLNTKNKKKHTHTQKHPSKK